MRCVLQASRLQLLAQHAAEQKAVLGIEIVVGDEDRMAVESVAECFRLAVVIPFFQKTIKHTAKSPKRYWKLVRFLESQISNPRNNNAPNMEKAMIEWSEDLEWVRRTFSHLVQ